MLNSNLLLLLFFCLYKILTSTQSFTFLKKIDLYVSAYIYVVARLKWISVQDDFNLHALISHFFSLYLYDNVSLSDTEVRNQTKLR